MRIADNSSCCGLGEITELSNYSSAIGALEALCEEHDDGEYFHEYEDRLIAGKVQIGFSHVLFTGVVRSKRGSVKVNYGRNFANLITKLGLGDVVVSARAKNPNSGNYIQCWIWTVNHEALNKWWKARNK